MKTTAEQIKRRLDSWNLTGFYDSVWAQAGSLVRDNYTGPGADNQTFKSFPDIQTMHKEIGTSSKILNACILMRASVFRSVVEPEFLQVDKHTAEVRKQFWLERAKGNGYADGDWLNVLAAAFMDAMPFGSGYVKFGAATNKETNLQYVTMDHVPILQFMFDRDEKTLARARGACDMVYMPEDQAISEFGKKLTEQHIHEMRDANTESTSRVVRVFEYWDTGYGGKGDPTRAVILGDITNDPVEIGDNYLGCLPYSHMEYLVVNNLRRPMGLVSLAAANQEDINQQERKRRQVAKDVGFAIVDQNELNPQDMERKNAGEGGVVVRYEGNLGLDKKPPFIRVPGGELSATDQWNWEQAMEEFRAITGTSELDNGSSVTGAETLGETQLVDQRSKKRAGLMLTQTALFLQRTVEKFVKVAQVIDNDPVTLDIFGNNIPLNLPGVDQSSIKLWLEEKGKVLIGEEALMKGDRLSERMERNAVLQSYMPFVGQLIDPVWFAEELLKNGGDDPKEALMSQTPMAAGTAPGLAGGMPPLGQGQPQTR